MSPRLEYIYNGHDNTIDLILSSTVDGVTSPADLSGVTRMKLTFDGTTIDTNDQGVSTGAGKNFDWTQGDGKLCLKLGSLDIPPGRYRKVELDVYDPANQDSILWGKLDIIVE